MISRGLAGPGGVGVTRTGSRQPVAGASVTQLLKVSISRNAIFGNEANYRVAGLSCPEAGGCKSAILRGFPNVFSLFGPCKVGKISCRYSWTTGMKKKSEILS